jgi:uncharacterized membrane protein YphA (DoxX/SURF4 family)
MNPSHWLDRVLETREGGWTLLVRLQLGLLVFLPEGIQKLAFPAIMGAGRFARFGIPWPGFFGPFVGVVEIVCGVLLIAGLLTRLATIALIIDMIVAITSTKIPILLGHGFWGFQLWNLPRYGFWSAQHESNLDDVMLLGSIFLLIVGAGRWSVDAWWSDSFACLRLLARNAQASAMHRQGSTDNT